MRLPKIDFRFLFYTPKNMKLKKKRTFLNVLLLDQYRQVNLLNSVNIKKTINYCNK